MISLVIPRSVLFSLILSVVGFFEGHTIPCGPILLGSENILRCRRQSDKPRTGDALRIEYRPWLGTVHQLKDPSWILIDENGDLLMI